MKIEIKGGRKLEIAFNHDPSISRYREKKKILSFIQSGKSFQIIGVPGVGKSHLISSMEEVYYLEDYLNRRSILPFLFKDKSIISHVDQSHFLLMNEKKISDYFLMKGRLSKPIVIDNANMISAADMDFIISLSTTTQVVLVSSYPSGPFLLKHPSVVHIKPYPKKSISQIIDSFARDSRVHLQEKDKARIISLAGNNLHYAKFLLNIEYQKKYLKLNSQEN